MHIYPRKCRKCDDSFETEIPQRFNCYRCSPARVNVGSVSQIRQFQSTDPVEQSPQPRSLPHEPAPSPAGELERVVVKELEALEWLETIEGRLCQSLARELDGPEVTGASRTSMTKQLAYMIQQIRDSAPGEPDAIDFARDKVRQIRLGGLGE